MGFDLLLDRNRIANDRHKRIALMLILVGCHGSVKTEAPKEVERPAPIVIDAFATPGGDGSASSPYKTFPPSLQPGAQLQVRSGLYRGPFVLPDGVSLEGRGEVVLTLEGVTGVVVTAEGRLTLHGVSVQGGAVGLRAAHQLELQRVHFSGHHQAALEVNAGAQLDAVDCVFKGLSAESRGVVVTDATMRADHLSFTGAYKRSIEATRSTVTVQNSTWEGPRTALHAIEGTTVIRHSSARGGSGPAFFAARGELTLEAVQVDGHEYAVQAGRETTLTVRGLTARRTLASGVTLVKTRASLSGLVLKSAGAMGSLHAIESQLTLSSSSISDSRSVAVLIRKGDARLSKVEINGVRADTELDGTHSLGDGVHVRDATVVLEELQVREAEGSSVFITAHSTATIRDLLSERAIEGALVAEGNSKVEASGVRASQTGSPAIAVLSGASLTLTSFESLGAEVPLWAECNEGVTVVVSGLKASSTPPMGPCVVKSKP